MVVEVRLFADFRKGRFKEKKLELPNGSSLADLLAQLKIPETKASILLVNGLTASGEHELHDNDVIAIFPAVAGG